MYKVMKWGSQALPTSGINARKFARHPALVIGCTWYTDHHLPDLVIINPSLFLPQVAR